MFFFATHKWNICASLIGAMGEKTTCLKPPARVDMEHNPPKFSIKSETFLGANAPVFWSIITCVPNILFLRLRGVCLIEIWAKDLNSQVIVEVFPTDQPPSVFFWGGVRSDEIVIWWEFCTHCYDLDSISPLFPGVLKFRGTNRDNIKKNI